MQPPKKSENIYPRTKENIQYIFEHFFPRETHSNIDSQVNHVYEYRGLELNQIEFIARQVAENSKELKEVMAPKSFGMASGYQIVSAAIYDFPSIAKSNQPTLAKVREYFSKKSNLD